MLNIKCPHVCQNLSEKQTGSNESKEIIVADGFNGGVYAFGGHVV